MKRLSTLLLGVLLGAGLAGSLAVLADQAPNANAIKDKIAKTLGIDRNHIRPSPMPGWYEVQKAHEFAYVSADGKYAMEGELTNLDTGEQLTEERRRADRLEALKELGADNMVIFAPRPPMAAKYVVTVFTDLDCPYCRKLHSQIADYNARGIAVRYIFFPRHGINSPTYWQEISVWCSPDRQAALTKAKQGGSIPSRKCENPVAREFQLAMDLGIRGTPGLILPDGTLFPGYLTPDELVELLSKQDTGAKAASVGNGKAKS
jgi:thiol:disulfide interchange protein DsbC